MKWDFYQCNIIWKYRHLWPFDWKTNVLVGPSHTQIEVSTQSGIFFYFVYHLIQISCMTSPYAAAYMLSHSFAPIYMGSLLYFIFYFCESLLCEGGGCKEHIHVTHIHLMFTLSSVICMSCLPLFSLCFLSCIYSTCTHMCVTSYSHTTCQRVFFTHYFTFHVIIIKPPTA